MFLSLIHISAAWMNEQFFPESKGDFKEFSKVLEESLLFLRSILRPPQSIFRVLLKHYNLHSSFYPKPEHLIILSLIHILFCLYLL